MGFIGKSKCTDDRSEELALDDTDLLVRTCHDRGFVVPTVSHAGRLFTPMDKGRAIGFGISDRGVDIVELCPGCQRAHLAVLVKRIPNPDFACFFCDPRKNFVMNRFVQEQP